MPKRLAERVLFRSRIFTIKEIDLSFENGKKATLEIIEKPDSCGVVPITERETIFLIKEYVAAIDAFVIDFPGGRVEHGLGFKETAQKELQEELGYKAGRLEKLAEFTLSPGYLTQKSTVFIAQNLVKSKLKGDEMIEPEIVEYSLEDLLNMIYKNEITEARTVATIFLTKNFLEKAKV